MRQLMGIGFVTAADQVTVHDRIVAQAETELFRLISDYDRPLPTHFIDELRGATLVLLADYVRDDRPPGVGARVDSGLIDPDTAFRELFCVAMTRGKQRNAAYPVHSRSPNPSCQRPNDECVLLGQAGGH